VNFHLTAEEAAYILVDSESRILFVGPETLERGIEAAKIARFEGAEISIVGWDV
jgi:long-subunit acyl-CoA synthetase (AMP-forming)